MQKLPLARQGSINIHRHLTIILCCIAFLLSGCTGALDSTSSQNTSATTSSATSHPASAKSDANGVNTEGASRAQLAKVQQLMQSMTLDQKLGQLIIVEYIGTDYQATELQYMISQQFVGGYLYQAVNHNFAAPHNTISSVNALAAQAMSDAKIPLLIAVDQEGGLVNKLQTFYGDAPAAADMTATGNPNVAFTQGTQTAKWMGQLAINADLAPVVDVGPVSNLLESRQFSADPNTVATYAGAFLNGLQNNGIAGCLKHFPGLGSLTQQDDPHNLLPVVNRSMADLENIDFAPYRLMIQKNHPAMIMSTDVITTAVDPNLPAELSPKVIDGVLRKELGYNGVVITDGLYMRGITAQWTLSQAAVLSIAAGNDLIEGPYTANQVAEVIVALKQALQQGQLTMERIDQSVQRILLMKVQQGIIK